MEGSRIPSDADDAETVADIIAELLVNRGYTPIPVDEPIGNRLKIFKFVSIVSTRTVIWVNTNYHRDYLRIRVHPNQPTNVDIIDRDLFGRITIDMTDPNVFDRFNELITRSESETGSEWLK